MSVYDAPAKESAQISRLKKRADFLRCRAGYFKKSRGFLFQARANGMDVSRVGFTCSKKVGNAVARNRAKRRLRAMAAEILPKYARPGFDYVFIGYKDVTGLIEFQKMCDDGAKILVAFHKD